MTTTPAQLAGELRLAYLITRFVNKLLSPAERRELDEWVGASEENIQTFEALTDDYFLEALARNPELVEALGRYHSQKPQKTAG